MALPGTCAENAIVIEGDDMAPSPTGPPSPPYDCGTPLSPYPNYQTPPYSPLSPCYSPHICSVTSPCYGCDNDTSTSPTGDQPATTCVNKDQCDHLTCSVCMDRKRNCLYTGCGHVYTCMDCALIMQDERPYIDCGEECDCESHVKYVCPICRTISTDLFEVFI